MINEIDFSLNYRVEAIPDKNQPEMAAKGIGVYPGTTQIIYAGYNNTLQRFVGTGLDEFDPKVLSLPADKRKEVTDKIKEKREELEAKIGSPGFLSPTSEGWVSDLTTVNISVGEDLKVRVNGHSNVLKPSENYKDAIALLLLFADDKFPKSKVDVGDPSFKGAKFYLTTDAELGKISKEGKTKKRKAYAFLEDMFDEKNPKKDKAWEVAYFLGLTNKQPDAVSIDELDTALDKAVNGSEELRNKFLEACEMDNTKLLVFNLLKKGINSSVIKVQKEGYYHFGATNLRTTKEESVDFLLKAGNETLLAELRSEVTKKAKNRKALA